MHRSMPSDTGGGFYTELVRYSFADYSPRKGYAAECTALGFCVDGTVGRATGLNLCRFGDCIAGGGVPVFVPESFYMVK